jgi:hypothetical protein
MFSFYSKTFKCQNLNLLVSKKNKIDGKAKNFKSSRIKTGKQARKLQGLRRTYLRHSEHEVKCNAVPPRRDYEAVNFIKCKHAGSQVVMIIFPEVSQYPLHSRPLLHTVQVPQCQRSHVLFLCIEQTYQLHR